MHGDCRQAGARLTCPRAHARIARMKLHRTLLSTALTSAALLAAALPATAAEVCFTSQNLDIPATTEGLYINFLNGVNAPTESGAPGFDFDPYAAASTTPTGQLRFYWGSASTGNAGVASSGDSYAVLPVGTRVGPSSVFSRAGFTGDTTAWTVGVTNGYLGFRFRNETSSRINYGWALISTTAPLGFPMTVHSWCFDDTGAIIQTGGVPVPEDIFTDGFDPAG
jgi:hypothetical protein